MRIFQVDAFTRTRFTGNPATVVLDADGLDGATLGSIAREFAHAEVAFVSAGDDSRLDVPHDVRLRFFNARKEAPFVGHATIAAHAVLLDLGRRRPGICRQLSGTGIIEVRATAGSESPSGNSASSALIEFRQTRPELEAPIPLKTTLRVADALRLPAARLHDSMPARIARKGSTRLLVPVTDRHALTGLLPDADTLIALGNELGTDGFFVFAVERDGESVFTESRMFCPALGIPEDPVSGNAHAMLAAYLWELGQLPRGTTVFIGRQGGHMNRPGEVRVTLEAAAGNLLAAHIGGSAVIVSDGTLSL